MTPIIGTQIGYVIAGIGSAALAAAAITIRRSRFSSENLLILTGFCLIALSIWSENLNLVGSLGGEFGFDSEKSIVWQGIEHGHFGFWQLAGGIAGAIFVGVAVAMKTTRLARLSERFESLMWLLPRLLAGTAAVVVIVAAMPRLSGAGACPPEDPHGHELASWSNGSVADGCRYRGHGL